MRSANRLEGPPGVGRNRLLRRLKTDHRVLNTLAIAGALALSSASAGALVWAADAPVAGTPAPPPPAAPPSPTPDLTPTPSIAPIPPLSPPPAPSSPSPSPSPSAPTLVAPEVPSEERPAAPAAPAASPRPTPASAAQASAAPLPGELKAVKDDVNNPGYLPGYRTSQSLSLSPYAPSVGSLPGGVTPGYGAPMPLGQWTFRFSGFFTASLQGSLDRRARDRRRPVAVRCFTFPRRRWMNTGRSSVRRPYRGSGWR